MDKGELVNEEKNKSYGVNSVNHDFRPSSQRGDYDNGMDLEYADKRKLEAVKKKIEAGALREGEITKVLRGMLATFPEALRFLIAHYGSIKPREMRNLLKEDGSYYYSLIESYTGVDRHKISDYMGGTSSPSKWDILRLCGGLRLPRKISYQLFEIAGFKINSSLKECDLVINQLLTDLPQDGLEQWEEVLGEEKFNKKYFS